MKKLIKKYFLLCFLPLLIFGKDEYLESLKVGNLSLPASQQPGPLMGFGQNIIDKHDLLFYNYVSLLSGKNKKYVNVNPLLLYGLRDDLSIFMQVPVAAHYQLGSRCSSGIQDIMFQLEYAPYMHSTSRSNLQFTAVGALYVPAGSIRKFPPTGFNSIAFFLGATCSYLAVDWYAYVSPGGVITTEVNGTKAGNQLLYQAGFGRNIAYKPDEWILMWMIEMSGNDTSQRKIDGELRNDIGGNVILLGPSLWFSTQRFFMQLGVAGVPYQNLIGDQPKNNFYFAVNFGWKF